MKRRTVLRITLVITALLATTLFVLCMLQNPGGQPSPEPNPITNAAVPNKAEGVKQTAARYSLPVRLKIPKINVDAPIDQMGLTPEGDMQSPSKPQHVGWYKFGVRPGSNGSAVIAGHYGLRKDGQVPVFNALHTLNKGDRLYTEDEKGVTTTFLVQEFQTYAPNTVAPNVFGSSDGKAHLNLVTCQGAWDATRQTYTGRLVVFSTKE